MNREEAIKTIKENCCAMCAYASHNMDSCDIRGCDNKDAIKVLEQEPCDDAISRKTVAEILNHQRFGILKRSWCIISEKLSELPPVKPAEKVGHWIAQDIHNCHTDFRCSKCGYIHDFMHLYGKPTADYTYCPNCGAKMQEVEE